MTSVVSVIVRARVDDPALLSTCLRPLIADPYPAKQLIVVNDRSSPSAVAAARAARVTVVDVDPAASGPAHAGNVGASISAGEVLFFVDADVEIVGGGLQEVLARFEDRSVGAIFGVESARSPFTNFSSVYRNLWVRFVLLRLPPRADQLHMSCAAIRTSTFRAIGGFDEDLRHLEDVDMGQKILAAGSSILRDSELSFRHHKYLDLGSLLETDRARAAGIVAWLARSPGLTRAVTAAYSVPRPHRYGLLAFWSAVPAMGLAIATGQPPSLALVLSVVLAVVFRADLLWTMARARSATFAAQAAAFIVLDYVWVTVGVVQGALHALTIPRRPPRSS